MKPGGTSGVPEPKYVDEVLPEHLPDGLLSIVVFGPGQGEAILVRLPNGEFGVVDGCREPKTDVGYGDPVRELLHRFNPSSLAFVGLTHAHDDHYSGLGQLLKAYQTRVKRVWITTMMTGPTPNPLLRGIETPAPERPVALRCGEPRAEFVARNTTIPITPGGGTRNDTKRNAVAVSLDASGNITQLVLAGQADTYDV